ALALAACLGALGSLQAQAWRGLVEEEWRRQDEERVREVREPGVVRTVKGEVRWGGVAAGGALAVPRAPAPALDGRLDDPGWRGAAEVRGDAAAGEPSFLLCHDGQRLHVAATLPAGAEARFRGGPTAADAAGAADGVKDGRYAFHTGLEPRPWWEVDLGEPREIARIVVYNRLDYAPGLHNADSLAVLTSEDGERWTLRHDNGGRHFGGVSGGGPLAVELGTGDERPAPATARFVRLELRSAAPVFFHLDEVEVYGRDRPDVNLALRRPARQSSLSIWSRGGLLGTALCRLGGTPVNLDGAVGPDGRPAGAVAVGRDGGTTTLEASVPLRDERGRFPGEIAIAGGRTLALRLAAAWRVAWSEGAMPGFGRNRLAFEVLAPGPLEPPVEVALEHTAFTGRGLEARRSTPVACRGPGAFELQVDVEREGAAAFVLEARQGETVWREGRAVLVPPVRETIERARSLLADFGLPASAEIVELEARACALEARERAEGPDPPPREALCREARWAAREVAFRNPLLNFDRLLFVKRFTQQSYPDVCLNHMPWVSRPGGDICVLSPVRPDGTVRPLLAGALGPGHVHGADLWFDGTRVVFGYARARSHEPPAGWLDRSRSYELRRSEEPIHIFEIGIDGKGLRQVTGGEWSDLDPAYLPSGEIGFVSERCGYSLQCNELDKDETSCNLYAVRPDGSGLRRLSVTKDGDYLPHVLDDGLIAYTRWEYHERSWAFIQSIWTVRPDGTMADAVFKQHFNDPWALEEARSVPGTRKLVAIATGHHTLPAGPVVVVDPSLGVNEARGIRIVTPGVAPPEGGMSGRPVEEGGVLGPGAYMTPWPLSEKHFLAAYAGGGMTDEKGYALYLIDVHGTRELVYRDPEISCVAPIPLRERPRPPVLSGAARGVHEDAICLVTDAGEGLDGLERRRIRYIRISEPVGWPYDNDHGGQRYEPDVKAVMLNWNPVRVLGTVPVEADGSACFRVPADRALYFQALDEDHMELLRMRSFVSFQPGEVRSCSGCHETRNRAPAASARPPLLALQREPSVPAPPPWGDRPIQFLRDVQPVFDRHCASCHSGLKPAGGLDFSGGLTERHNRAFDTIQAAGLVARSNVGDDAKVTPPLAFGSHRSKLIESIRGSHADMVRLGAEDWLRLVTWIDANAPYHGGFIDKRPEKPHYDLAADVACREGIASIHGRRCAACHDPLAVSRPDWIDLVAPERSLFLAAPLAREAGGAARCREAVYRDASDADYREVRAAVEAAVRRAWEAPRRDLAW
ncbi:MAG: discoidin domain-containing protein, partial [Planctomycetes bacterium]|nr:discoidin domain-containing protein [Planctomycetota bacterium]